MVVVKQGNSGLSFSVCQTWQSFEQFRSQGAKALEAVKHGKIATLQTRTGQYRIVEESDFQAIYGLARDVDRLRGGLRVVALAVRAVQANPGKESLDVLTATVAMLGSLPELPVRDRFDELVPEGLELDEDDEVILDPNLIERPLQGDPSVGSV